MEYKDDERVTTINDPLVGTTYDRRYRIERRIGAGGMANVYLAEDETLGRRVAIKVLHQRYAEDSQFVERFLREASAAARLNHPNIVQVYDRGQSDSTYYIAMEYVDGMTLKDLVQRRGGLTEQEVLAYARQGLHALRFAHRNGIVHRDIKPHNMMVDTDGRLKIADFGIARAGADSGLTEAGSIVGTAQYLSPEQAQGHDVSATSDLYSLGVVMFEMSTGRVPFDGDSPVNVALKHVKDPVPHPSSLKPGITEAIESIILKAMEKDPARRYASADEMLADLDRAREGSTTQAMTQVLGGLGTQTTRVTPIAGATQVTPITPLPMPNRRYEQPLAAPERAWPDDRLDDEEFDDRGPWRWLAPLLVVLLLAAAAAYFLLSGSNGDPVPDVVGQTTAAARASIEADGFDVGDVTTEFDDETRGLVIEQNPDSGEDAEPGSDVDIVVSKGPETTGIPDVTGLARQVALDRLSAAGFEPRARLEESDDVEEDRVIRTDPAAEAQGDAGEAVTVFVSSGQAARGVPNVVGRQIDDARSILNADEYNFDINESPVNSNQPRGEVIGQDPAPGGELEEGGPISLTVASGSNAVPPVAGLSEGEAQRTLENAGFTADVMSEDVDDPAQDGIVIGSDPEEGQERELGTTVQLTVGRAPEEPVEPVEPTEPTEPAQPDENGDGIPDAVVPGGATDPEVPARPNGRGRASAALRRHRA